MKPTHRGLAAHIVAIVACSLLAGSALSQDAAPAPPDINEFMKQAEQRAAPVKEHKLLEPLVGDWNVESKLWYQPNLDPLIATGKASNAWTLAGRFLKCEAKVGGDNTFSGESISIYGFDTRSNKFTVYAIDTAGTYSVSAQGDYDAASKTFTLLGENEESQVKVSFKWVVRIVDTDHHSQEVHLKLPEIGWFKVAENIYTRVK